MKRIYIVLLCVFCISVVLLGFSFSKESGTNDLSFLDEFETTQYRVVFSPSKKINTVNNKTILVSFTNKNDILSNVIVTLKEVNDLEYKNVFYKVNNGPEHLLVDNSFELGSLEAFGTDGDHKTFKLDVYTKDKTEYNFNIYIGQEDVNLNTLKNNIMDSSQVYTDSKGNVRFYGVDVNNYILYNNEKYRVIGIVDDKVKIISEIKGLGVYNTELGEYATLEDYFGTYNDVNVNSDNVLSYKSWINDRGFWLLDSQDKQAYFGSASYGVGLYYKNTSYYLRYVYYIDGDTLLVSGDGTINNPYEVTYGS
jgi:hypothetical protein